jgi:hypothetical protein
VNSEWREWLDRIWSGLEETSPSSERALRVAETPVETADGALAVAVDHEGHRHVLVPVRSHHKTRGGIDGPVLQLRRRPLMDTDSYQEFVDLACLRSDLNDVFTSLCADIVTAVQETPQAPVKALYQVIDRWKALFRSGGPLLGPEQMAGLFGELLVLKKLLHTDPSAHRLWRGPGRHRHDFGNGGHAVEVKSGVGREGRRVRIHGLEQLEAPAGGTLRLAWFKLERATGAGTGLVELIEQTMRLCDDESALLTLLAAAGYRAADAAHYSDVRFVVSEDRWYDVSADFPKLTGELLAEAGVSIQVREVDYTIDLPGDPSVAVGDGEVDAYLRAMIEESV